MFLQGRNQSPYKYMKRKPLLASVNLSLWISEWFQVEELSLGGTTSPCWRSTNQSCSGRRKVQSTSSYTHLTMWSMPCFIHHWCLFPCGWTKRERGGQVSRFGKSGRAWITSLIFSKLLTFPLGSCVRRNCNLIISLILFWLLICLLFITK